MDKKRCLTPRNKFYSKSIFFIVHFNSLFTQKPDHWYIRYKYTFTKLRTFNNYHLIKTGTCRWNDTDRNLRTCTVCYCNRIDDEFHYTVECTHFNSNNRKMSLFTRYCKKKKSKVY